MAFALAGAIRLNLILLVVVAISITTTDRLHRLYYRRVVIMGMRAILTFGKLM